MKKFVKKNRTLCLIVSAALIVIGLALLIFDLASPFGKKYEYEVDDNHTSVVEFISFDEYKVYQKEDSDTSIVSEYVLKDGKICTVTEVLNSRIETETFEYSFATLTGVGSENEYTSAGAVFVLIISIVLMCAGAGLGTYTCKNSKGKKR